MLAKLKRRLSDANNDALLQDLLDQSAAYIRGYTRRSAVPDDLADAQVQLAVVLYNRMGMEGETHHTEGEVSRTAAPFPDDLMRLLNNYRLANTL